MKVLFDNGTPKPIERKLVGHQCFHARQLGWHELRNGELIRTAEASGFDVLLTTDKNIRYQQDLRNRVIAIVVLSNSQWPNVKLQLERIAAAVNVARPGSYSEVEIPYRS